ncbi:NADPH:quinone reductase [Aciditerrimonas ferrireducens]|uniref:NADPH:quinone reductase n=1 Tax=Aciditerrimonas ferrireducens TaxID=667306 RepID=UPI0020058370|nr:NADPH:quinone reductase [Aciditerrimonas ferrireducens]MCK4177317.1 NADPH:quinone reductase [Aciditerrimonas ferrireducens]
MRAALYRQLGDPSVLSVEEIPTPEPGPGQVRVKVVCSGVNPTDWKSRSGRTAGPPDGFQVPHQDGAGIVDAVGPGVTDRQPGQRVWVYLAAANNRYGTAAEYCLVPAERTVPLPDHASFELGASLGVPALTAAHCLGGDPAALRGATVLVAGGAGAVGHAAIELARHAGARVVATVSTDEKAELARRAGADAVVFYRAPDAVEQVRAAAPRVDRIVELALGANLELDLAVSDAGTTIAVYANEPTDPVLPVRRCMTANVTLAFVLLYGVRPAALAAALAWVRRAVDDQALTTLPLHRYTLDQVADAQRAVEAGAVGKVLVLPHAEPSSTSSS